MLVFEVCFILILLAAQASMSKGAVESSSVRSVLYINSTSCSGFNE